MPEIKLCVICGKKIPRVLGERESRYINIKTCRAAKDKHWSPCSKELQRRELQATRERVKLEGESACKKKASYREKDAQRSRELNGVYAEVAAPVKQKHVHISHTSNLEQRRINQACDDLQMVPLQARLHLLPQVAWLYQ